MKCIDVLPATIFFSLHILSIKSHIFYIKNACSSLFDPYLRICFNYPHINGNISFPLFYCVVKCLILNLLSNPVSFIFSNIKIFNKYPILIKIFFYSYRLINRVLTSLFKHSFPNIDTVSSLGLEGVCTTSSSPMSSEGSTVFLSCIKFTRTQ